MFILTLQFIADYQLGIQRIIQVRHNYCYDRVNLVYYSFLEEVWLSSVEVMMKWWRCMPSSVEVIIFSKSVEDMLKNIFLRNLKSPLKYVGYSHDGQPNFSS